MITITLPYPVSANRYWRTRTVCGHAVTYVSAEAKAYRKNVMAILRERGVTEPIRGRVSISYLLYPKLPKDWETRQRKLGAAWDDGVQCLDLDNAQKVLIDSLKEAAFEDDKWVWRISGQRMEPDDGGARVVVSIGKSMSANNDFTGESQNPRHIARSMK